MYGGVLEFRIKNLELRISLRQRYKEIENVKLKIKNEIQKITFYYLSEIPPPLGGRLGGGLKNNEELRIKNLPSAEFQSKKIIDSR